MRFEDLEAWQEARRLTRDVYDLTRNNDLARDFAVLPQILCIDRRTGNELSRLRRGISTSKLTTHAHSSGRANGPVRRNFSRGEERQRSLCDLRSPGGKNSASPLARLFVPADQRTGTPVLPLLPPPAVGGGNISFISGSNNAIH